MAQSPSPFHHQFEKLTQLPEEERDDLMAELLRHGPSICAPLVEYLTSHTHRPRLAPLLELLGKIMDDHATATLIRFLDSQVAELRLAAATGLGWNRARAALEKLDEMEVNDPDPRVRRESFAAIEEILRDFPALRETLHHHGPTDQPIVGRGGEPATRSDEERTKLMAALPRLLAVKYQCLPVRIQQDGTLQIAVPRGQERTHLAKMTQLTGHEVELVSWSPEQIATHIDQFYTLGDDDFCAFNERLTPEARQEVVALILASVHPDEPACPLNEANDAVEAAQLFLTTCCAFKSVHITIVHTAETMQIRGEGFDSQPLEMTPPEEPLRERFLDALMILAGLIPSTALGEQSGGLIRLAHLPGRPSATVAAERILEGRNLTFHFSP